MAAPEPFSPRLALVPPDASPEAHLARMLALRDALTSLLNEHRATTGLEPLPPTHDHIAQLVKVNRALIEDLPPILEFGFGSVRIYIERTGGRVVLRVASGKDRRIS